MPSFVSSLVTAVSAILNGAAIVSPSLPKMMPSATASSPIFARSPTTGISSSSFRIFRNVPVTLDTVTIAGITVSFKISASASTVFGSNASIIALPSVKISLAMTTTDWRVSSKNFLTSRGLSLIHFVALSIAAVSCCTSVSPEPELAEVSAPIKRPAAPSRSSHPLRWRSAVPKKRSILS